MNLVSFLSILTILSTLASFAKYPNSRNHPNGSANDPFSLLSPCLYSRHHQMVYKLKKLYRLPSPNKHSQGTSLLYISILLVTLSNDVQIQPGPRIPKYPCGVTRIVQDLGWRSLDQRRADARLCLFFKVIHGLVAVPLPDYVQYSNRISRYCHSMTFRQVYTSRDYYKYSFFPLAIVQWNSLPESVASLQNLEAFKAAVCKLQHSRP